MREKGGGKIHAKYTGQRTVYADGWIRGLVEWIQSLVPVEYFIFLFDQGRNWKITIYTIKMVLSTGVDVHEELLLMMISTLIN